ncbi:MAG: hypothetical protein KAS48_07885 [Gammaproteobacteria bacterium]|nr:hypothetical protein [Gammaproteobacteria bacterium]
MEAIDQNNRYTVAFRGSFAGILRWHQLDEFWENLRNSITADPAEDWYIYAVGEEPPETSSDKDQLHTFITEIDILLRKEHEEDYCGVVYVDDFNTPSFVKIFDPNNLGVSCGFSDNPPLPGWILSVIPPVDLKVALAPPGNRSRWWKKLFA